MATEESEKLQADFDSIGGLSGLIFFFLRLPPFVTFVWDSLRGVFDLEFFSGSCKTSDFSVILDLLGAFGLFCLGVGESGKLQDNFDVIGRLFDLLFSDFFGVFFWVVLDSSTDFLNFVSFLLNAVESSTDQIVPNRCEV